MSITIYDEKTAKDFVIFFRNVGLTENGIAGLAGNIVKESGFKTNNLQNSYEKKWNVTDESYTSNVDHGTWTSPEGAIFATDKGGYGLCQWTSTGRKKALLDYANMLNVSIADPQMQFNYLWKELNNSYTKTLKVLKDPAASLRDCAVQVVVDFERPANKNTKSCQDARTSAAEEFKAKYMDTNLNQNGDVKRHSIAINAGHWYGNTGKAVPKFMPILAGVTEFELNNRVVTQICEDLKPYNIDVYRVDDPTGKTKIELDARIKKAEQLKVDEYYSFHHNAASGITVPTWTGGGTVVYHYQGTGKGATFERNHRVATEILNNIKATTGLIGNRSKPVCPTNNLYECNKPTMDSYLIEIAFMNSITDIYYINDEDWAKKVSAGFVNFLVHHFNLYKVEEAAVAPVKEVTTEPIIAIDTTVPESYKVRVTINNLRVRERPSTLSKVTLYPLQPGIYTIVETNGKWGKLKSGIGWIHLDYTKKL